MCACSTCPVLRCMGPKHAETHPCLLHRAAQRRVVHHTNQPPKEAELHARSLSKLSPSTILRSAVPGHVWAPRSFSLHRPDHVGLWNSDCTVGGPGPVLRCILGKLAMGMFALPLTKNEFLTLSFAWEAGVSFPSSLRCELFEETCWREARLQRSSKRGVADVEFCGGVGDARFRVRAIAEEGITAPWSWRLLGRPVQQTWTD